jgi:hypothetical protein
MKHVMVQARIGCERVKRTAEMQQKQAQMLRQKQQQKVAEKEVTQAAKHV